MKIRTQEVTEQLNNLIHNSHVAQKEFFLDEHSKENITAELFHILARSLLHQLEAHNSSPEVFEAPETVLFAQALLGIENVEDVADKITSSIFVIFSLTIDLMEQQDFSDQAALDITIHQLARGIQDIHNPKEIVPAFESTLARLFLGMLKE